MNDIDNQIKTLIEIQVIQALKSAPEAIDAMVKAALSKPVDAITGSTERGWGSKIPYLEYVAGDIIRDAARNSVIKVVADMKPDIEAHVRKALTADKMVDAMTAAFLRTAQEEWRISVKFERDKE